MNYEVIQEEEQSISQCQWGKKKKQEHLPQTLACIHQTYYR